MAQAEVITVRMSRGNLETSWGFDIVAPLTISNVVGGSLADRAGLLNGDTLVELEGHDNLDLTFAKQLLQKTEHKVELVVHRTGSELHRIWKPSITKNIESSFFQQHSARSEQDSSSRNITTTTTTTTGATGAVPSSAPQSTIPNPPPPPPPPPSSQPSLSTEVPLKVSLEHQSQESMNIPGFNVSAQPFGAHQEVKHLQYNSPMPLYSPQSAAEQYLQQTGGLFGTDPNLGKMKETPSYLRSETLRLIQENEQSKDSSAAHHIRSVQPPSASNDEIRSASHTVTSGGPPQCYLCGRNILGVMCRAFDRALHAECFQCATCGASLKNQGHHFVNEKFYCDVHGRQLKGGRRYDDHQHQHQQQHHYQYQQQQQQQPAANTTAITTTTTTNMAAAAVPHATATANAANTATSNVRSTSFHTQQQQTGRGSSNVTEPKRTQENVRAFYQPEVMSRGPLSVSPTPWKTQGPISPSNRGVPTTGVRYGQDLRNESYTSSSTIANQTIGPSRFTKTTTTTQQNIRQTADDSARGRGTLQTQSTRIPFCEQCKQQIRGAYVLANGLAWCPEHFVCANKACNRRLLDIGFVEEKGQKYCERCFEELIAPHCAKCNRSITADCLNALQKQWHPQCFVCAHCHKPFGNSAFFLEQGLPYCEADWNALFTTKCVSCHYPIEAGDRWVEALGSAFHSNCFNCTSCNVNLEGESFYAKNGAPYCKLHA